MKTRAAWMLLGCLMVAKNSLASDGFPDVVRSEWGVTSLGVSGRGCLLCHSNEAGGIATVRQKFGITLRDRYRVTSKNAGALRSALGKMRSDGTDSDGDRVSDYEELLNGTNLNVFDAMPEPQPEPEPEPGSGGETDSIGGADAGTEGGAPSNTGGRAGSTPNPPDVPPEEPDLPMLETGCSAHPGTGATLPLANLALAGLALVTFRATRGSGPRRRSLQYRRRSS
jgi:hypothetical protein